MIGDWGAVVVVVIGGWWWMIGGLLVKIGVVLVGWVSISG